jgi:CheY-like chemotaxis protein
MTAPDSRPTVLVAEDEPGVRLVARLGLELAGYAVLEAAGGTEAVRASHSYAGPIHLLLTDVHLPGMCGVAVAAAVRARHPDAKVLFTSGMLGAGLEQVADAAFLLKPFTPSSLAATVGEVLGR